MVALLGSLMVLVGAVWIAVIAFQNEDTIWGIGSIFCGLAALIYGVLHFDEAKAPLGIMGLGVVIAIVGRLMAAGG